MSGIWRGAVSSLPSHLHCLERSGLPSFQAEDWKAINHLCFNFKIWHCNSLSNDKVYYKTKLAIIRPLLFPYPVVWKPASECQLRLHSCRLHFAEQSLARDGLLLHLQPPQMCHGGGGQASQQSSGSEYDNFVARSDLIFGHQGPWEWADALFLEESGERLVVQDETIFELTVWQIPTTTIISRSRRHVFCSCQICWLKILYK